VVSKDAIVINHADWDRVRSNLGAFTPAFRRDLRQRIKHAAEDASQSVRDTLALPSPGGGPDNTGGRAALIAATRVSVTFGKNGVRAAIVTSSDQLPEKHKGLLKVYNMEFFRHPVFETEDQHSLRSLGFTHLKPAEKANWVEQQGRPYFGRVLTKQLQKTAVIEIRAALQTAMLATGAK
jgi:hypothetical protein